MAEIEAVEPVLEEFVSHRLITDVLHTIKGGKEAAAYLCRAHRDLGVPFAVAKVYHERNRRNFANDGAYVDGRVILTGQVARAVANRSAFGREASYALWVDHEFEVLSALHYAGADVPEPYAATERAILMAYAGNEDAAAPQLQHARLATNEAAALFERLMWNVELLLGQNVVHGDLSPYNVLVADGRPVIIDFPQAVDPRFNEHARELLGRDVRNVARYFERHGVTFDAERQVAGLWRRWRMGDLG